MGRRDELSDLPYIIIIPLFPHIPYIINILLRPQSVNLSLLVISPHPAP